MTDTPQWPLTSSDEQDYDVTAFPGEWVPHDPLTVIDLPHLVFPRPLVDKALINRDTEEETSDE